MCSTTSSKYLSGFFLSPLGDSRHCGSALRHQAEAFLAAHMVLIGKKKRKEKPK